MLKELKDFRTWFKPVPLFLFEVVRLHMQTFDLTAVTLSSVVFFFCLFSNTSLHSSPSSKVVLFLTRSNWLPTGNSFKAFYFCALRS